jgi:hypothetical protein
MQKNKMPVYSSHLALRFYYRDGWTEELLNSLCSVGRVTCKFTEDEYRYMTLDHNLNSKFDLQELVKYISAVNRYSPGADEDLTDFEYLQQFNW